MSDIGDSIRELIFHESFGLARKYLLSYRDRQSSVLPDEYWKLLARQKEYSVAQGHQLTSKAVWCLETTGKIQDSFILSILQLKDDAFEEAWNSLCECESQISLLDWHFREIKEEFGLEHVRTHAKQLRELYPLKIGISPGMVIHEKKCSICDAVLGLRTGCEHKVNEIYDGEFCHIIVSDFEPFHIAIVDNPAQRSTYIWPDIDGNPNFALLNQLSHLLSSPWDVWSYTTEERRSFHPAFKNVGRNERCPCRSGNKYKRCCLLRETVPDFPHFQFELFRRNIGDPA